MATEPLISDTVQIGILIVLGMVIIFLIIREIRIMKTANRTVELELEKDKLKLLQQSAEAKSFPFTRLSKEQTDEIRVVDDDNRDLETTIYAKERLIDTRLKRLENYVRIGKLDTMMGKIEHDEKKVK